MKSLHLNRLTSLVLGVGLAASVFAGDADVRVDAPKRGGHVNVRVGLGSGGGSTVPVPITWEDPDGDGVMTAEAKMYQIVNYLRNEMNPPWDVDPLSYSEDEAYVVFHGFHSGTTLTIGPGDTGEAADSATAAAVSTGAIRFGDRFEPFESPNRPAIFTAGIVTDVGRLSVQVSAQELNFQTDGPIICQALFQRLAPRAPQYGAQVNYAGDRLEVDFNPAYTVTQGGVIFGTTSPSTGCTGTIVIPNAPPCPGDIDGDGSVGLGDLAGLLAAFGSAAGDPAFNSAADLDSNGVVELADLARLLTLYGTNCP